MRIRVAAGILRDVEGRVLLAERINDISFRGLWEFPGGKIDPSEAPEAGLSRELTEELGIVVTKLERLASVEHDYPDRLVHIDFFLVTEWCDEVRAMDGQALRWVLPENINHDEILPADVEVIEALSRRSLAQPRNRPL
jgi:8-oxo-dGTP diphosphatase